MKTLNHKGDEMLTDKDLDIESIVLDLRAMIESARREDWQGLLARCVVVDVEARRLARMSESETRKTEDCNQPGHWADYWATIQE